MNAENLKGFVSLGITLVLTGAFTKISMDRTGEFRIGAPIVGFVISMIAVTGSEALVKWIFSKKEGKIEDVKLVGEIAGVIVWGLILQAFFGLLLGFGLFVVGRILGF